MKKIHVSASSPYDIILGKGLLNECGRYISSVSKAAKIAIVTDDTVDALYSEKVTSSLLDSGFSVCKFVFPHGENSKSIQTLTELYFFLAENDITRSDLLIALGGGVVGDLCGFCAATYLRGIDFVQIPTTLLAQVDSSVGGKTAVNIPAGKNLVGAFKQPLLVISDTDTLSTLSEEIFADGMGEVIKYGVIRSEKLFSVLETGEFSDKIEDIIGECVTIKRDIVQKDEFDTGERMLLNFGHTLGHAIEKHCNFNGISHGKAVAIGMMLITNAGEKSGTVNKGTADRLKKCLISNGLPFSCDISPDILFSESTNDKKRTAEKIRIILCPCIGKSEIVTMTLDEYKKLLIG